MESIEKVFADVEQYTQRNKIEHTIEAIINDYMHDIRKLVHKLNHDLPYKKRLELLDAIWEKQNEVYKLRRQLKVIKVKQFWKKLLTDLRSVN